ncbi:MAG: hypothetical protein JNM06_20330 [Blastocatellia bacterium]|nr:hypothetical protein [Blastocatellia bacterium]MBN8725173.1 hypothetical protein [Acidobacteriota bacterium]
MDIREQIKTSEFYKSISAANKPKRLFILSKIPKHYNYEGVGILQESLSTTGIIPKP